MGMGSTYVVGMFLLFTLYCIFLCWTLKCSNLSAFFFLISLYKAKAKYSKYSTSKSTIKTRDSCCTARSIKRQFRYSGDAVDPIYPPWPWPSPWVWLWLEVSYAIFVSATRATDFQSCHAACCYPCACGRARVAVIGDWVVWASRVSGAN